VTKSFASPGNYTVSVKGEFLSRGLKSVTGCEVVAGQGSLRVDVVDAAAEARVRRVEAEAAQAAAKAREEQERVELEKRQFDQRQQELARRELEIRQRELALKEAELKRSGPSNPTPTPSPQITEAERRQRLAEEREQAQRERQLKAQAEREAQEEARKKAAEERERLAAARRQEMEEERARLAQAREDAERRKREEAEAERQRIASAKMEAERSKRQAIESALMRPLISRQDPRVACQSAWESDPQFQPIASKISITSVTDINFQMLADGNLPAPKERQAIASLAESFNRCISEGNAFRRANYHPDVQSLLNQEDTKVLELKLDLYNRKITYGKYNLAVQQLVRDTKTRLEALADRVRAEQARQEDAARSRAAALVDAQRRQEEQQRSEAAAQERARQADAARRAEARQRWDARCRFDAKNAYDRYLKSKENDCAGPNRGLAALCAMGVLAGADEYQKSAYASCMSSAP
jgi:hypothetical protein